MIALLGSGMENEADEYLKTTAPMIKSYELKGILALADAGYKDHASNLHSASCDFAHVDCVDYASYVMRELRDRGLRKEALEIQEMLDASLKDQRRVESAWN